MQTADAEQFQRDGVLVVRGVLREALPAILAAARRIQERTRATLPPGTRFWSGGVPLCEDERPWATWGVDEITRRSLFDPVLVDVLGHPGIVETLAGLVQDPRAWGLKLLWNPTVRTYDLHWHRDVIPVPDHDLCAFKPVENDHVQFNAALTRDHSFRVVPGSHRRLLTPAEHAAVGGRDPLPDEHIIELEAGDVLFMDAHALHRGSARMDEDRLTLHYSVQASWVPLVPWGEAEDFAWIQSADFVQRISPAARPAYKRLHTATRAEDPVAWLRARRR